MLRPDKPARIAWVAVEPAPYLVPLFERLRHTPGLEMHCFFCARQVHQPWWKDSYQSLASPGSEGRQVRLAGLYFNRAVLRAVARDRWDAVVLSGYSQWTTLLLIAWCLWRRIPLLIYSDTHDLKARAWWKRAVKRVLLFPLLRRAAAGLAAGCLAKRYWESVGVPPERVFLLPYPSHLDAFRLSAEQTEALRRERRSELGIADDVVVGLCVGRLAAVKGYDLALEALARLAPERRPTLLFVGDGPERGKLESSARAAALGARFLGYRSNDDLPSLYAAADFFLLPSREEPWGVVVAEAMAAGLPVVLSDQVGAAYDLLEPGRNGFLVPAGAPDVLRDVLRDVLETCATQPRRLAGMGAQSRAAIAGWTCESAAGRFCKAVETVLTKAAT